MTAPHAPQDPFDVLGLPPTFDLAREAIERAYLARSRRLHPDLVDPKTGTDAAGHADAERSAAELNRAARLLRDAESRANALLARLGGPAKDQDKSLPAGFLAGMLDVRIEIEAARGDPNERARWETWAQDQRSAFIDRIATLFRGHAATMPEPARREARQTLNAWRYIERLIEQLDPAYDPARADFEHP